MPAMANIVCKKADETTNVTYDALTPSGGDAGTARWRQDTGANAAVPPELRATLFMRTMDHDQGRSRKAVGTYRRPYAYLDTNTSLYKGELAVSGRVELVIPKGMPAAEQAEGIYQFLNAIAASLFKQAALAGYAP